MSWQFDLWTSTWYWESDGPDDIPPWRVSPLTPKIEPPGESPMFRLEFASSMALDAAVSACQDDELIGFPNRRGENLAFMPETMAGVVFPRLERLGLRPTGISIRATSVSPTGLERIRRIIGPDIPVALD